MEKFIVVMFLFFVFNSMWVELCFHFTIDVTMVHIWILEYIYFLFYNLNFVVCYYYKL
jgi:hypothetical protein